MTWRTGGFVVPPCRVCGAPGDTECHEDCSKHDFRMAALDEWEAESDPEIRRRYE
jgi:hypothetical protein